MKMYFMVSGMSCAACSARVQQAVEKLNIFSSVSVNLLTGRMITELSPETDLSDGELKAAVIGAVKKAGYIAEPLEAFEVTGQQMNKEKPVEGGLRGNRFFLQAVGDRRVKRLILSVVLLVILAYSAMGQMIGLPVPSVISRIESPVIYTAFQAVLSLAIILINFKYYVNGFRNLFRLSPNMDSLIAVGSSISFVYSAVLSAGVVAEVLNGNGALASEIAGRLFYESAGMIPTFISIGKYLEERSREKTKSALTRLISLRPAKALRYIPPENNNGVSGEVEINISEIMPGDILAVKNGEAVPCDGSIVFGNGSLNEAMLTGEGLPVEKKTGDSVFEATINVQGYFRMRAEKTGEDTLFAEIIRLVEEASSTKAPIERLTDRISRIFVPAVLGIAIIVFFIWLLSGADFSFAVSMGVSVMVISCPCSLGLATPTAVMAGTGRGAEMGILIKSAEGLQKLHKCDTVVLDKTGTLTAGELKVVETKAAEGIDRSMLVMLTGRIEQLSVHPIGRAVAGYGEKVGSIAIRSMEKKYSDTACTDTKNRKLFELYNLFDGFLSDFIAEDIPGGGLSVKKDDDIILCGNLSLMKQNDVYIGPELMEAAEINLSKGCTVFFAALNKRAIGIFAISDSLRPDAAEAVRQFEKLGMSVIMLTGDNERTAGEIADRTGISRYHASLSPADKEGMLRKLQEEGHRVIMVGDGINDAPALMRADAGIAIGSGTDIAIDSADVVITGDKLCAASAAIGLSRATMRNIKQNLFWAFFYNLLGIPVAAGALYPVFGIKLNPMLCAVCMSLSSLFVVSNALRLRYFNKKR